MNLIALNQIVTSLRDHAESQRSLDDLQHRHDPSPSITHLQHAAHILENLPLSVLASLPAFTPPPPTFP